MGTDEAYKVCLAVNNNRTFSWGLAFGAALKSPLDCKSARKFSNLATRSFKLVSLMLLVPTRPLRRV